MTLFQWSLLLIFRNNGQDNKEHDLNRRKMEIPIFGDKNFAFSKSYSSVAEHVGHDIQHFLAKHWVPGPRHGRIVVACFPTKKFIWGGASGAPSYSAFVRCKWGKIVKMGASEASH